MAENNHSGQKFTPEQLAVRDELLKFCREPFPNGAEIKEWNGVDGGMAPDGTIKRTIPETCRECGGTCGPTERRICLAEFEGSGF